MGMGDWFSGPGFQLLQSLGIIGGLIFTAISLRLESASRRIENLHAIVERHRNLWSQLHKDPHLARIIDPHLDLKQVVPSEKERNFILMLVLHLSVAFRASNAGLYELPKYIRQDIQQFFSLPLPQAVWNQISPFQDDDFVKFVEYILK